MNLKEIQSALREQGIDAWLFYDHHHRDPIAYRVLGLPESLFVTQPAYAWAAVVTFVLLKVIDLTVGLRALAHFPLGSRFELLATGDVAAALVRPRFQLDSRDVWRPGPVAASLGMGASVRFF